MVPPPPPIAEPSAPFAQRLASRIVLGGCGAVVVAVLLWFGIGAVTVGWLIWDARPRSQIEFDAVRWRDATAPADTRYRMRDSLFARHHFEGQPAATVEELLGPGCRDCHPFGEDTFSYRLGPRPWAFLSFDSVWLVFELDVADNITGHRIQTVYN